MKPADLISIYRQHLEQVRLYALSKILFGPVVLLLSSLILLLTLSGPYRIAGWIGLAVSLPLLLLVSWWKRRLFQKTTESEAALSLDELLNSKERFVTLKSFSESAGLEQAPPQLEVVSAQIAGLLAKGLPAFPKSPLSKSEKFSFALASVAFLLLLALPPLAQQPIPLTTAERIEAIKQIQAAANEPDLSPEAQQALSDLADVLNDADASLDELSDAVESAEENLSSSGASLNLAPQQAAKSSEPNKAAQAPQPEQAKQEEPSEQQKQEETKQHEKQQSGSEGEKGEDGQNQSQSQQTPQSGDDGKPEQAQSGGQGQGGQGDGSQGEGSGEGKQGGDQKPQAGKSGGQGGGGKNDEQNKSDAQQDQEANGADSQQQSAQQESGEQKAGQQQAGEKNEGQPDNKSQADSGKSDAGQGQSQSGQAQAQQALDDLRQKLDQKSEGAGQSGSNKKPSDSMKEKNSEPGKNSPPSAAEAAKDPAAKPGQKQQGSKGDRSQAPQSEGSDKEEGFGGEKAHSPPSPQTNQQAQKPGPEDGGDEGYLKAPQNETPQVEIPLGDDKLNIVGSSQNRQIKRPNGAKAQTAISSEKFQKPSEQSGERKQSIPVEYLDMID